MVQIVYFITFVLAFCMFLRIAFFPFFILDKGMKPFQAIRLSLATTRGNFIRIVLLLAFFALFGSFYLYFSYRGYAVISSGLSMVISFVIVPLSSVSFISSEERLVGKKC